MSNEVQLPSYRTRWYQEKFVQDSREPLVISRCITALLLPPHCYLLLLLGVNGDLESPAICV